MDLRCEGVAFAKVSNFVSTKAVSNLTFLGYLGLQLDLGVLEVVLGQLSLLLRVHLFGLFLQVYKVN
jgi:hypothetical protein